MINFVPHFAQILDQATQQTISNTSSLSSVASVDLDLLQDQIKFFNNTNTQLGDSFDRYVKAFYFLALSAGSPAL